MRIDIDWGNSEETILVVAFEQGWNSNDYIEMVKQVHAIFISKPQTIHILLDVQHSIESPQNLISMIQATLRDIPKDTPNVGIIAFISRTSFWRRIFTVASQVIPSPYPIHFVKDTNEAYNLIGKFDLKENITLQEPSTYQHCILYIEDNEMNFNIVKDIMESPENLILCANNSAEAYDIIDEYLPDVIIMDYHLIDEDGATIVKNLKADSTTKHIPIIGLTADIYAREALMRAGCDIYLNKPIRRKLLQDSINKLLNQNAES